VHRIGRTGRAGAEGMAFSFCDAEERAYLRDINKVTSQLIPVVEEHPFKLLASDFRPRQGASASNRRSPNRHHTNNKRPMQQPMKNIILNQTKSA
jgi:ATP-dependent RNA helicase RhlE